MYLLQLLAMYHVDLADSALWFFVVFWHLLLYEYTSFPFLFYLSNTFGCIWYFAMPNFVDLALAPSMIQKYPPDILIFEMQE